MQCRMSIHMKGLEKKHTQYLYGCAILMMQFHHLFSVPERLNGNAIETYSNEYSLFIGFAWSCKLCVAIFAFLSGYGMMKSSYIYKKKIKEANYSIIDGYKVSLKRYLRFMKKYWLVFLVFYLFGLSINKVKLMSIEQMIRCLLGLSDYINREWWYVKQYIIFLLFFPILEFMLFNIKTKKIGRFFLCIISTCIALILYISFTSMSNVIILARAILGSPVYWIIFLIGMCCAISGLFERITCFLPEKKTIRFFIGASFIIFVFFMRISFSIDADYNDIDMFLIIPLICGLLLIGNSNCWLEKIFCQLGKHSTYIWLTHTFYCYYYFENFFNAMHSKAVQLVVLIIVSYLTAILLQRLQENCDIYFIHATK